MFKSFCASHGIIHQFTIPYNPQQYGRAERFNGTLINSTKALLNDAKLSHHFWEYAVETANYIHNRIPHSGIQNKIPYEILFKSKIDYAHFKVFGCRVFYYVPKSFQNKFDNNVLPGIFLGYHPSSSSYKILSLSTNKIILSRSVIFFENNPANSTSTTFIPKEYSNFIPNHEIGRYTESMKKDNYYNINNNIKMSSPVNTSYRLHQSQTSSSSSIHNHDKNKIIDNNQ